MISASAANARSAAAPPAIVARSRVNRRDSGLILARYPFPEIQHSELPRPPSNVGAIELGIQIEHACRVAHVALGVVGAPGPFELGENGVFRRDERDPRAEGEVHGSPAAELLGAEATVLADNQIHLGRAGHLDGVELMALAQRFPRTVRIDVEPPPSAVLSVNSSSCPAAGSMTTSAS